MIPARLGSTRLPRKPLFRVAGRPLLEWVWRRAVALGVCDEVVVATDSVEVAEAARGFGARVEMTSSEHPSGTDRVAEVAQRPEYLQFRTILNVQGDEPFLEREQVSAAVDLVRDGGWDIGTVASPITSPEELADPSVVKVVRGEDGGALLFSRAAIPFLRDRLPTPEDFAGGLFLRHIGIYTYSNHALLAWTRLRPGRLELAEKLEQLRPLAAGFRIGVSIVDPPERGIDTPADAARAERRLREELVEVSDD